MCLLEIPKDLIIYKDGVPLQNGDELHIPDLTLQPKLECLAKNANPEATLQWSLSLSDRSINLNGNQTLTYLPGPQFENLTTTSLLLTNALLRTWQDGNLKCTSQHPGYKGVTPSVNVILKLSSTY